MQDNKWMNWAMKLQAIAQAGLAYSTNKYDIERFNEIRNISVEIIKEHSEMDTIKIKDIFASEKGYQTPKVDVRSVIFKNDKILLVQETDSNQWCLPGGWADAGLTLKENVIKETKEEAGILVECKRILALMDRNKNNHPAIPLSIYKIFVECTYLLGEFKENNETINSGYFSMDELPPLIIGKTTKEQLELLFKASRAENLTPYFD